jgi:hypothetical protein
MAEDFVSRDQHRADLAELTLAFKEELHGVRQDVAVLGKTVEHLAQTMGDLRGQMGDLRGQMDRQFGDLRQEFRDLRNTTQRQMWVIVGGILLALLKIVFFP